MSWSSTRSVSDFYFYFFIFLFFTKKSLIGEVYQISQSIDSLTGELRETESNLKKLRDDHQMLVKEIEMKKNSIYIDQQKTMPIRMRYPTVQRLLGYNG